MKRIILIVLCATFSEALADAPRYPDHSDLLVYRDADNAQHPVRSAKDWSIRRRHILQGMQQAMGELPGRDDLPALDVKIVERVKEKSYTRMTITFVAEKGDRIPAYLYVPHAAPPGDKQGEKQGGESKKRFPAMLALHPTHRIGKGVVDGQSERPNRAYAKELAQRGYVVIAPDYPSFGDYKDYDFSKDRYVSGTMKGVFNHMRCVDLLASRDDVDAERIGVIGHSLGGHNAMFVGVFDTRLKVIVSSCGWTPFHDYYGGDIKGWTSDRYMPRLRDVYKLNADRVPFNFYEVVAALAPRAFFTNSPLRDSNFDVRGVRKAIPKAKQVYDLLDARPMLQARYPDAEHDFPEKVRQEAYRFIDSVLKK